MPNLVHIGRTVLNLYFVFSSAAILDFENGGFGTYDVLRVLRRSSLPNLVKIGLTVQELFKFFFL